MSNTPLILKNILISCQKRRALNQDGFFFRAILISGVTELNEAPSIDYTTTPPSTLPGWITGLPKNTQTILRTSVESRLFNVSDPDDTRLALGELSQSIATILFNRWSQELEEGKSTE